MPFDGVTTKHITEELNKTLKGGRIRKIYQPESDEIRLTVNVNRENPVLLLSANPNNSRVHLTKTTKANPDTPPTFCMSLRKHLTGAEILGFEQIGSDRVLTMNVRAVDEFGEPCVKKLVCEVTGRNSNIVLVQESGDESYILDCLKRVGASKSRFRQILPGRPYLAPPNETRKNFDDFSVEELIDLMNSSHKSIEQFFTSNFLGVSPALAREVAYRARLDSSSLFSELDPGEVRRLAQAFDYLISHLDEAEPATYSANHQILDFYGIKLNHLGAEEKRYETFSEMLEAFYSLRDKRMHFRTRSANLRHQLETLRKKNAKKLRNLDKDLRKSEKNDTNKLYGDLITANIWQLKRGMEEAELLDYTADPPVMVKVPLKVNETPSQNAQRFYKKYSKNKRAQEQLTKQIEKTADELDYIETLLSALSTCTEPEELDEISYEFSHSDLVPQKSKRQQQRAKKPKPSKPMHFISSEGFDIYVGKNNYQNDYISTRLGEAEDCWLHVKDAPGSHVLIVADGKFITEQTVLEGGMLAAHYSKMGSSENIPVDYMEFKFVKKPKNAKPGLVTFTQHNTMYITPDLDVIEGLDRVN